ncbi:MAG: hypothetical protein GOMPHAMPRED_005459 [Gomphillus americanus]|uniref:Ribosomal protein/NADH dehydrogenase domain-containing protein n=1 Tax=Gomphillus americanus TaxID=1940652 RepID=A0A8H3FUW4_9LECA|nr:MAG: hypothetical protein GOMPHAMPRED_005459 [Gomphillus americanus]
MGFRGRMRALNTFFLVYTLPAKEDPNLLPQQLLQIRFGPGAAILPKEIKRIHLDFAYNWNNGHLGPRRFWRQCLPRLKYHNPMVSMTVQRTTDQDSKPVMTIYFDGATTKTIDMRMKTDTDILQEFMESTNATEVTPSPEEALELEEVKEQAVKSEEDRRRNKAELLAEREEKRLMERARQMI